MLCPYCNEEIKDGAKKCRFCGEFLDGSKKEETKSPEIIIKQDTLSEITYAKDKIIHCPSCKYEGKAEKKLKGNWFIGLILYLVFIIGGIIYSIRRRSDCKCKCPKCGNTLLGMGATENGVQQVNNEKKSNAVRIVLGILLFFAMCGTVGRMSENNTTQPTQQEKQNDPVQERIARLQELYADEPTFEKVELIDKNTLGMYFTSTPDLGIDDSIDSITRGQASNLSREINGVASFKTFVGGNAQMFCTATKGQVNNCQDYR